MESRSFVLDDEAFSRRKIVFRGYSKVDPSRPLVVRYPSEYPSLPPNVYSDTPENYLPRHQHRVSGEICTFGQKRVRWTASKFGADAVDEAEDVISKFSVAASPVLDDDAPEPITAEFEYDGDYYLLLPKEIAAVIREASAGTTGTIGIFLKSEKIQSINTTRGVIVEVSIGGTKITVPEYYKKWPVGSGNKAEGNLVVLDSPPIVPKNSKDFFGWLGRFGRVKLKSWTIFAYPDQTIEKTKSQLQLFGVYIPNGSSRKTVKVNQMIDDDRTSRIPNLGGLTEKKVLLIGCGSLGSKIAVNLAATGVKEFRLIDTDFMEPGNAVRHEVGAGSFGLPKSYALLRRMNDINPDTHIGSAWLKWAIGDPNTKVEFDESLQGLVQKSDLVIEATGVHGIGRYVNDLCFYFGVPALFVGITNGAWSGEVIRTIPEKTACWMCWVNQYYENKPPSEPGPPQGVFAPGCNQPTFTGSTYEVGMVANLASWFAVDTLLLEEQGRKHIPGNFLRWTARDGSGNPILKTEILNIDKRPGCNWCG